MTDVLDAFALVALALDERAAGEVENVLRRGQATVTAINLAEAMDTLARAHGQPMQRLRTTFAALDEVLTVRDVDEVLAWRAAELRARHYHRSKSPLALADCVVIAAAGPQDVIATADGPLARAARREGIEIIALPDRRGRRP